MRERETRGGGARIGRGRVPGARGLSWAGPGLGWVGLGRVAGPKTHDTHNHRS
jgi:hypothetical protein